MLRQPQSDDWLKLSHVRKVSPGGYWRAKRQEWTATIGNSFGLPSGVSCPGKTDFCKSCYGEASERQTGTKTVMYHNARLLTEAGDALGMVRLLDEMIARYKREADYMQLESRDRLFRIHWNGDFFSLEYATAWRHVMLDHPDVQFWAYTRSFLEPVNVVPILHDVPNLMLYLSVDEDNVDVARDVLYEYQLPVALCGSDYESCRAVMPERQALVCPENSRKMPMMKDGRGACMDCRWCPDGGRDVLFAVSKQENVKVRVTRKIGVCERNGCENPVMAGLGSGRKPRFCGRECQVKAYRRVPV